MNFFLFITISVIATVKCGKLVFTKRNFEVVQFEPASGFSCKDVIPTSKELSWLEKLRSPSYSTQDMVCKFHLGVQYNWSFDFPNNENIEKGFPNGGKFAIPGISDKHPEEFLFYPKPGFTCADWPESEELNWFSKFINPNYKTSDKICSIPIRPNVEESFHWPKGSSVYKMGRKTFRGKTYPSIF